MLQARLAPIDSHGENGYTALMLAAMHNHDDTVHALLEHLYTGDSPLFGTSGDESRDFGFAVELLQVCPATLSAPNLLFVVVLPPVSQLMPVRLLMSTCWTAFARSASSTSHRLCETTPWCSCPTSLTVPTRLN